MTQEQQPSPRHGQMRARKLGAYFKEEGVCSCGSSGCADPHGGAPGPAAAGPVPRAAVLREAGQVMRTWLAAEEPEPAGVDRPARVPRQRYEAWLATEVASCAECSDEEPETSTPPPRTASDDASASDDNSDDDSDDDDDPLRHERHAAQDEPLAPSGKVDAPPVPARASCGSEGGLEPRAGRRARSSHPPPAPSPVRRCPRRRLRPTARVGRRR